MVVKVEYVFNFKMILIGRVLEPSAILITKFLIVMGIVHWRSTSAWIGILNIMSLFTKLEARGIAIILLALVVIATPNFIVSLRRARDAQRKADIGSIHDSLLKYQADFGHFPLSVNGKIAACEPVTFAESGGIKSPVFSPCEFGKDSLRDVSDLSYPAYMSLIPNDPQKDKGYSYLYVSNGSRFQIYGTLEGKGEDEYDESIIKRGLSCSEKICNFGKSFAKTPLNISIEEYESTLNK